MSSSTFRFLTIVHSKAANVLKSNARIASSYQQRNFASHYILFVLLTEGATVVWAYWTVAF